MHRPPVLPVLSGQVYRLPRYEQRPVAGAPGPNAPAAAQALTPAAGGVMWNMPVHPPVRSTTPRWPPPFKTVNPAPAMVSPPQTAPPAQYPGAAAQERQPERPAPGRRPRHVVPEPKEDERGSPVSARPILNMTRRVGAVRDTIGNPRVSASVQSIAQNRTERDGKFHWYNRDGVRFYHRYDQDHDRDWFGFYKGKTVIPTIYYNDHYWWQEPRSRRWLSYWRDHWWWHSPQGAYYVYIGQQYYQWNPNPDGVVLVETAPEPAEEPLEGKMALLPQSPAGAEQSSGSAPSGTWLDMGNVAPPPSWDEPTYNYSADGTRMVQVEGRERSAYLYDTTKKEADGANKLIRFMEKGVHEVRFSDTSRGAPLQIILSVLDEDGRTRRVCLDADGNPVSAEEQGAAAQVNFGEPASPGYDAPGLDLPPTEAPMPDGY